MNETICGGSTGANPPIVTISNNDSEESKEKEEDEDK